jgi:hypothetical protein
VKDLIEWIERHDAMIYRSQQRADPETFHWTVIVGSGRNQSFTARHLADALSQADAWLQSESEESR